MVHHGGSGVASWALALRVPQVIIPVDMEKEVIARTLVRAHAAIALNLGESPEQLQAALEDARNLPQQRIQHSIVYPHQFSEKLLTRVFANNVIMSPTL